MPYPAVAENANACKCTKKDKEVKCVCYDYSNFFNDIVIQTIRLNGFCYLLGKR